MLVWGKMGVRTEMTVRVHIGLEVIRYWNWGTYRGLVGLRKIRMGLLQGLSLFQKWEYSGFHISFVANGCQKWDHWWDPHWSKGREC